MLLLLLFLVDFAVCFCCFINFISLSWTSCVVLVGFRFPVAEAVALGIAAFVKSEDDTRYKSARHSGALSNSTYSPISFTPNTERLFTTNEEALYYFNLIKKAISRINNGKHPKDRFHLKLSGGSFEISNGNFSVVQINDVTTAIALSNIYHVLKAMECDMDGLVVYLKAYGVPTLIVATSTGNTPPYDAEDFELEGLYDDAQKCHL
jgi:hypothetical protein